MTKSIGPVPENLGNESLDDFLRQVRLRLIDIQAGRVATLLGGTGGTATPGATGPAGPPGPAGTPYVPDLTPPPTVSGGAVSAGLDFVFITTDAPTFTQGNGYNRTLVYGATYSGTGPLPTFAAAVLVHEFVGQVGSFGSEPATQWHIWLRWRSRDGVLSVSPAGGANGYQATTGVSVSQLLIALTGSIRASELQAALSARIDLIDAGSGVAGSVNARILTETTARTSANTALSSSITTLNANVAGNTADISAEITARANADTASAARIDTLRVAVNPGTISDDPEFVGYPEFWLLNSATAVGGSQANRVAFRAAAQTETHSRNTYAVNPAKQYRVSGRFRAGGGAHSARTLYLTLALQDAAGVNINGDGTYWFYPSPSGASAPSTSWTDYSGVFGFDTARTFPANARYMRVLAILMYDSTGTAPLGGWHEVEFLRIEDAEAQRVDAAVQTEISTRASVDGHMSALYAVRVALTNGGRTIQGGFGIMGTSGGTAGPTIDFGVLADRFYIGAPVGSTGVADVLPFIVQTTDTTINGQAVPRGVYMDTAFIRDGTIVTAKIGDATITNAKIVSLAATKITAGTIAVGEYIQSSDYVNTVSGWRIGGNMAEFGASYIRGQLTASQIDTRNLDIRDGAGTIIFSAGVNLSNSRVAGLGAFSTLSQITSGNVSTYIASAAIGNAQIGGDIQSTVYTPGSAGWIIRRSGSAEFDAVHIRGQITTGQIANGAVTPTQLAVSQLSAISADMGAITAGTVTLNTSGHIKSGQTAYATGTGWWLGFDATVPKFSIGDASAYMRWTGSNLVIKVAAVELPALTASISPDPLSVSVANGLQSYGSVTVTPSGGTAPYQYAWSYTDQSAVLGATFIVDNTGSTASFSGTGTNTADNFGAAVCVVTDVNGRATTAYAYVYATHGTPP